jgi:hypothetical protein
MPTLKEVEKKGMQRSSDEMIANCQYLDLSVYQLTGVRRRMLGRVRIWREGFIAYLDMTLVLTNTSLDQTS